MKKIIILLNILIFFCLFLNSQNIKIVTEEFPPYNFTDNNGDVIGISTDIVRAILEDLKIDIKITKKNNVFPRTRAINTALVDNNTCIFSIPKNKENENSFKWVGVTAPYDIYFYSLSEREDIIINNFNDLKKYIIGTTKNDECEKYFLERGFILGENIDSNDRHSTNYIKLLKKRIDLWPIAEYIAIYYAINDRKDQNQLYKKLFRIKDLSNEGLYIAFSLKTPDDLVLNFKNSLEKLKNNGIVDQIIKKYIVKN